MAGAADAPKPRDEIQQEIERYIYIRARASFFFCAFVCFLAFHVGVCDCATLRWFLQMYVCLWGENGSPSSSTGPSVLYSLSC